MNSLPKVGFDFNTSLFALQNNFNVTRLPDYLNAPEAYIGHLFMSRPSLNFTPHPEYGRSGSPANSTQDNTSSIADIGEMCEYVNDKELYKLVSCLSHYSKSMWIPLVYNRAKTYTTMEYDLKINDSNATFFGHTMKYGQRNEEHKKGKNITIDFRNDRFLSIYHLMNFWSLYIKYISNTSYLTPLDENRFTATIDYGASIYYVVTKRNNKDIVYQEKLLNIFPVSPGPGTIFNYNDNLINQEDTISVDFVYSVAADPRDPSILADMNELSLGSGSLKGSSSLKVLKNSAGLIDTQTLAKKPYIASSKNSTTGKVKNQLLWSN